MTGPDAGRGGPSCAAGAAGSIPEDGSSESAAGRVGRPVRGGTVSVQGNLRPAAAPEQFNERHCRQRSMAAGIRQPRRRSFEGQALRGEVSAVGTADDFIAIRQGRHGERRFAVEAAGPGQVEFEVGEISGLDAPDKPMPEGSTEDQVESDEQQADGLLESMETSQLITFAVHYRRDGTILQPLIPGAFQALPPELSPPGAPTKRGQPHRTDPLNVWWS